MVLPRTETAMTTLDGYHSRVMGSASQLHLEGGSPGDVNSIFMISHRNLFILASMVIALCAVIFIDSTAAENHIVVYKERTDVSIEPGENTTFNIYVINNNNTSESINITINDDIFNWMSFNNNSSNNITLLLRPFDNISVQILIDLPKYLEALPNERAGLWLPYYNTTLLVLSDNNNTIETINLSTRILWIDLAITSIKIPNHYENNMPMVGDSLIFNITVRNYGGLGVSNARIFLWVDTIQQNQVPWFKDISGNYFIKVDLQPMTKKIVPFVWSVSSGDYRNINAVINPSYLDVGERPPNNNPFSHPIDELSRYYNNAFPRGGLAFEQPIGNVISFRILPDIYIKNVSYFPVNIYGDDKITFSVTIGNKGTEDWSISNQDAVLISNVLTITIVDDYGRTINKSIDNISLLIDDEVMVNLTWIAPHVVINTNVTLFIKIKMYVGSTSIDQLTSKNDQVQIDFFVVGNKNDDTFKLSHNYFRFLLLIIIIIISLFLFYYYKKHH